MQEAGLARTPRAANAYDIRRMASEQSVTDAPH